MATPVDTCGNRSAGLSLRLSARPAQAVLLRAQLRLWLAEQHATEDETLDILVAVTEAFNNAVGDTRQLRSIAVDVEGRNDEGVVEILVRDYGRWQEEQASAEVGSGLHLMHVLMDAVEVRCTRAGTVVRLRRVLGPRPIALSDAATSREERDRCALLWRDPIFAPLPGAMLERLAAQLIPVSAALEDAIIHEGDPGDRFYLIAQGQVEVSAKHRHVATLGPGRHVGEIALLRDVARTATVTATKPVVLYALPSDEFLSAVTSHPMSGQAAASTVATRLAELYGVLGRTA